MNKYDLVPRIVENKDWVTFVFIISLGIIAITKAAFEKRFSDFVNLLVNDKYLKIYKDSSNLMTWFTILLFIVQLISLSFFIQLLLSFLGYTTKTNGIAFIQIFTAMSFFILSKFLVEKIIATSFNIENLIEQFNLYKVSYRTYIGLFLLPINITLYYTVFLNYYVIISLVVILLAINTITYLISLKNYQKLIMSKMFYFILYICTLEIAPYCFIYYLIKN
ncbi:DUF4271 domain-containing protein [Flavobacterium sp.]|uniref:DUF4271 domain-containing protein n=1 Tax=Flavobacterium sp. TaxID=239 RepID=UPI00286DC9B3|nr:DUF4271 domain-containing protein [Flavobacterium sp.]